MVVKEDQNVRKIFFWVFKIVINDLQLFIKHFCIYVLGRIKFLRL